jgi:ATP-dependent Clp protease ATP-binding subunit ClpA
MDNATLTDNNGKKADFRNVILVMTTNAGARELVSEDIGFRAAASKDGKDAEPSKQSFSKTGASSVFGAGKSKTAIETTFSPEFRNRLDGHIAFNQLGVDHIKLVVDKFIKELRGQLTERNVTLDLTEEARTWLANKGYDRLYGARPMARLIQQKVKEPLSEDLLFGQLEHGGHARLEIENDQLAIKITPAESKRSSANGSAPKSPEQAPPAPEKEPSVIPLDQIKKEPVVE